MTFFELNTKNGGTQDPCTMVSDYLRHEENGGTLASFLSGFDFESREELERAIRTFVRVVSLDPYMRLKHLSETNPFASSVHTRYNKIFTDESKLSKMPVVLSGEIWHGGFSRQRLEQRTQSFFEGVVPNKAKFEKTCKTLRDVYGLSDEDIEKIHFFVEQVKAGEQFPNSLRRMLYIWGVTKKTGKTTSATMLVSLLNGDTNEGNIAKYSTSLTNEMQIKAFSVPKISECNVCLMDECFYADMGKTYADFKRFITSANGRARLPFGQEFEWTGYPNYVATSNEPLQKFIKDWNDRRYLSIEFKEKPKKQLTFDAIKQLWMDFILNSTKEKDWQDWANEIALISEEKGERQEVADDIEIELRKLDMLNFILERECPNESAFCPENRVPLKMFVDYFSKTMGTTEAHKRKGEIESAVLKVFGARYSTTGYWLLSDMKSKAQELKYEIYYGGKRESTSDVSVKADGGNDEPLPF